MFENMFKIMFSYWKDWPFVEFAVRAAWAVPFSKSLGNFQQLECP